MSISGRSSPAIRCNAGLPDVMAHGMLSAGLLASALTKWFGAGSVRRYSIRFRSPVWPGDVLTAHCRSAETLVDDSGYIADLALELARGNGDVVIAGTARVTIADPSRLEPR